MRKIMILLATVAFLASCSDNDDPITPKDFSLKTFAADMGYEKPQGGGMANNFTHKKQTYMKFDKAEPIAIGKYGENSWTTFDILPKVPNDKGVLIDNKNYNVTTNVIDWDLLFTQYKGNAMKGRGDGVMPYFLTGVLINTENVEVALYKYEDSKDEAEITKMFKDLTLANVTNLKYSKEIDCIGTAWKGMPPTYHPKTNFFYIAKTKSGNVYKVRFVGVYGSTKSERIFTCEYALMK